MADQKKWVRDLLILPIIVGLVVALVTFVLPKLFSQKKSLSYRLEGQINYFGNLPLGSVKLEVDGNQVKELYGYNVRVWNSGSVPLKDIPVGLHFDGSPSGFKILKVNHSTTPKHQFGKIEEDLTTKNSVQLKYELLNPKDEDLITVFTNRESAPELFAKAEGLKIKQLQVEDTSKSWLNIFKIVFAGLSIVIALGTSLLKYFYEYLEVKRKNAANKTNSAAAKLSRD